MRDAVRIGLRRPDVVVDGLCERLAGCVELEDRDDFARFRLFDQVVIVKTPIGRDIGPKTAAGMTGVTARPRPHVEDAHFQDIASFRILDRDRPGQEMNPKTFTRSLDEWTLGRAGATTRHRFVLAGPVKHAFRAGIIGDHALIVVVSMMGQRFDRGAISRPQRQSRRDLLAEIAPVNGRRRNRQRKVSHANAPLKAARKIAAIVTRSCASENVIAPPPAPCRLASR